MAVRPLRRVRGDLLTRIDDQTRDFVSWHRRWRPELSPAAYHEFLVQRYGHKGPVPSVASIRAILEERGHVAPPELPEGRELDPPIPGTFAPNDVWCVDLVGGAAAVIDSYTGYLLRLDPVGGDLGFEVEQTLRSAFREHGLPRIVRGRAAPPFLVDGPQGLSRLDLWIVRCGMVLDRRPDAPMVSVPFAAPPAAASFGERVRATDLFRKRHNETEVVGYRSSSVPLRTPVDVSELFIAETVDSDKHGKVRWSRHRLALGAELASTPITFWGSEWIRFAEVKIKDIPLGMVDHLHPERGLIPAPIQGRLSLVPPTLEVDWEPILVAYLRDEPPAASSPRARRRPTSRRAGSP